MQNLVIIKDLQGLQTLREYLEDKEFVAFDTETTGVTEEAEIIGYSICAENNIGCYVITAAWNKDTQSLDYLQTRDASKELLQDLKRKSLIMHNGSFDCARVWDNYRISLIEALHTDTMIMAHLVDENRSVGLKELGEGAYGASARKEQEEMKNSVHANGGQLTKNCYELYKADAELIANYGAKDAILTYNLFHKILEELQDEGMVDFFYKDESNQFIKVSNAGQELARAMGLKTPYTNKDKREFIQMANDNFGETYRQEGTVWDKAKRSQLEPRVFASQSQDETLMKSFANGEDFYSVVGAPIFGHPEASTYKNDTDSFAKKYPQLRDKSKVLALATPYGRTARQQAEAMGIEFEESQDLINRYFSMYPKVELMMLTAHEEAKNRGYVTNLFGRKRRIPEAMKIRELYGNTLHAELPYTARTLLNLAMNHKVQSTGASIVNRAAIMFFDKAKQIGIDAAIVLQVHDELVVECKEEEAHDVVAILKHCMENAVTLPGVELVAEPKIGMAAFETWAKSIIDTYGFPDNDSIRFALATMIMHSGPTDAYRPKRYFALCVKAGMAKQIASAQFTAIKERQQAAAKAEQDKQAEATAKLTVVDSGQQH
ncbi:unnamed protein product [Sphagnum balticum]